MKYGVDMGDSNPRQLCGKNRCEVEEVDRRIKDVLYVEECGRTAKLGKDLLDMETKNFTITKKIEELKKVVKYAEAVKEKDVNNYIKLLEYHINNLYYLCFCLISITSITSPFMLGWSCLGL